MWTLSVCGLLVCTTCIAYNDCTLVQCEYCEGIVHDYNENVLSTHPRQNVTICSGRFAMLLLKTRWALADESLAMPTLDYRTIYWAGRCPPKYALYFFCQVAG